MVEAGVNRNPEQYKETSDAQDAKMISYLVDVLLLQRDSAFPSSGLSAEERVLMRWSQIGKGMMGQIPDNHNMAEQDTPRL